MFYVCLLFTCKLRKFIMYIKCYSKVLLCAQDRGRYQIFAILSGRLVDKVWETLLYCNHLNNKVLQLQVNFQSFNLKKYLVIEAMQLEKRQ